MLEWFKLDLNSGNPADHPHWMDSWVHFIAELQSTFGPHDPVTDAEHQLEHLQMKDLYCVTQYIVDLNRLTSQVQDYGDGTLHRLFYSGLPDHLKDEITQVGKPLTQSSSGSKPDLTNKLGKDGKLTADECKWWLENNLCMFCGGTGHLVDNCPKKSKKAKAHAVAVTAKSGKMDSTNSGANSKLKKE